MARVWFRFNLHQSFLYYCEHFAITLAATDEQNLTVASIVILKTVSK